MSASERVWGALAAPKAFGIPVSHFQSVVRQGNARRANDLDRRDVSNDAAKYDNARDAASASGQVMRWVGPATVHNTPCTPGMH